MEKFLRTDVVYLDSDVTEVETAWSELLSALTMPSPSFEDGERAKSLSPELLRSALASVITREKTDSTAIGSGMAMPRAKISGLSRTLGILGVSKSGILYPRGEEFNGTPDGKPLHFIWLVLTNSETPGDVMRAMTEINRQRQNVDYLHGLLEASDAKSSTELLRVS